MILKVNAFRELKRSNDCSQVKDEKDCVAPGFVKGFNVLSCLRALPHTPWGAYYCLNQSVEHLSCSVDVLIQCLFSHVLKPEHVHPSLSPCWDHCRRVAFEDSSLYGHTCQKGHCMCACCCFWVFFFL